MGKDGLINVTWEGNLAARERFLTDGPDVDALDGHRVAALKYAPLPHPLKKTRLLSEYSSTRETKEQSFRCNVLLFACLSGEVNTVDFCTENRASTSSSDSIRGTTLTAACGVGNEAGVERIFNRGAGVCHENPFRDTALNLSPSAGHSKVTALLMPP